MNRPWVRTVVVLCVFAAVFIGLSVTSYTQKSATWDEPQHLIAGYAMLARHDHRVDPEHPPLLRMWAALPLMLDKNVNLDSTVVDQVDPGYWVGMGQFEYAHHYLYKQNDADRLLYRSRFMVVLLGVALGVLVFSWARELFGFWTAVVVLTLYCFEPNLQAHASLVTTDFGATCFMFGTLYCLWRFSRQRSVANAAGSILLFTLAMVSKFTTIMFVPVIVVLLVVDSCRKPDRLRSLGISAGILAGMVATSWLAMWAAYGFRYAPSANPSWLFHFEQGSPFGDRFPVFARLAVWADEHKLLPNACTQGFLLGQIKAQLRGAYLFGQLNETGWWYYFPVAFLIKTPVALLAMIGLGVVLTITQWRRLGNVPMYLLLPTVVIIGLSMTQKLNIGLRHILPVYPLMLMLCAVSADWLLRHGQRITVGVLVVLMAGEFATAYPSPLAFFNAFVGGPRNGHKYLVDSNLDWGQDLKPLKRWMDQHGVEHINLSYFGTAEPAYYGMQCTHLPGAPFFAEARAVPPRLPGYVAVSVTNLRGVYLSDAARRFYEPLLNRKPDAVIGYSIHVYWLERPWW